jgi:hypothetical protein
MLTKYLFKRLENISPLPDDQDAEQPAFNLEYYIVESEYYDESSQSKVNVFGIEVVKQLSDNASEYQLVKDIYCCREKAESLACTLSTHLVTPVSLVGIVEDALGI